jgi:hypothetical protein
MTKRLFLTISMGMVAAFALGFSSPARACNGDCDSHKNVNKAEKKDAPKPADKAEKKASAATAPSTLAAEACKCEPGGKGCTCPKGQCHCANCGQKLSAAEPCKCEPGGKGCTCPKGQCHCANCGQKAA